MGAISGTHKQRRDRRRDVSGVAAAVGFSARGLRGLGRILGGQEQRGSRLAFVLVGCCVCFIGQAAWGGSGDSRGRGGCLGSGSFSECVVPNAATHTGVDEQQQSRGKHIRGESSDTVCCYGSQRGEISGWGVCQRVAGRSGARRFVVHSSRRAAMPVLRGVAPEASQRVARNLLRKDPSDESRICFVRGAEQATRTSELPVLHSLSRRV